MATSKLMVKRKSRPAEYLADFHLRIEQTDRRLWDFIKDQAKKNRRTTPQEIIFMLYAQMGKEN